MYAQKQSKVVELNFGGVNNLPPQSIEAEEAILGGILLDPGAMTRVVDTLRPEAFYINAHREIYKAALALHTADRPCDLMMVATWLYDHDMLERVGGQSKLAELVDRTVSAVNIDRYVALVMDKYARRQLIQAGNEIAQMGYETAVELEEIRNEAEHKIFSLSPLGETSSDVEPPIDILLRIYNQLDAPKLKGFPTGIIDLDAVIGGLKRKKLYIVAGRSGMGKTQCSVHVAAQLLEKNHPVVFFSAEMDREELMTRILAWKSGVDAKKIEECTVESETDFTRISEALGHLSDIPLYLDDTSGSALTPARIRSGIRKATAMYGKPALVVLDYLQLLGDESVKNNRVTELDKLANGCKAIAKEFDVAFMALAQINRESDKQSNKRPVISQLRESGAIEQAADVILLLYRDEYYNPETPDRGICEIIVGKQRGGPVGTVKTLFKPETSQFLNLVRY
ncbi:replicative DNA helicase [Allocoleopsis sp.]|uniref:replicative DNA helicase n=1 Tax=Allocoleopsis sp. TaxID=3088169 RepID=UPI002FCEDC43